MPKTSPITIKHGCSLVIALVALGLDLRTAVKLTNLVTTEWKPLSHLFRSSIVGTVDIYVTASRQPHF